MPRPSARRALLNPPSGRPARAEPDVVELDDAGHQSVDADGHQERDSDQHRDLQAERLRGHGAERDHDDLGGEDEVGADRALDLVLLERDHVDVRRHDRMRELLLVRGRLVATGEVPVGDLLDALVAEERAAEHQQRGDEPGHERADRERRRDEDRLVDQRALGHRPHHGQLAARAHTGDLLRVERQIVTEHSGGLLRGGLGEDCDVVQHAGDVVEERKEAAGGHRGSAGSEEGTDRRINRQARMWRSRAVESSVHFRWRRVAAHACCGTFGRAAKPRWSRAGRLARASTSLPGVGHRQASTVLLPVEPRVEFVLRCAHGAGMGIVLGDGLLAE